MTDEEAAKLIENIGGKWGAAVGAAHVIREHIIQGEHVNTPPPSFTDILLCMVLVKLDERSN